MTKVVNVGGILIGGGNPVSVQSMTNTKTSDYNLTLNQITDLQSHGCDIVRLAVCSDEEVAVCNRLIKAVNIPLVADIQFDYKLAIKCSDIGFAKVRFNPGNIGSDSKVLELVKACKANHTPIRIGVNSGSMQKEVLQKYGKTAEGLAESALFHVALLEKYGYDDIVISVKSSNVKTMVESYRILSNKTNYPLHLGVTESGGKSMGTIKSAVGIGSLLLDGIGDTIRVSLSSSPALEVDVAKDILRAVGLDNNYCEIISCPTCSRCNYNLEEVVDKVALLTKNVKKRMKIAIMGCVVNGPGEAKDCDFGVAGGGEGKAVLFRNGEIIATIDSSEIYNKIEQMLKEI